MRFRAGKSLIPVGQTHEIAWVYGRLGARWARRGGLVEVAVLDPGQPALADEGDPELMCSTRTLPVAIAAKMPVTSRMLTTPSSLPFSTTGKCRIQRAAISLAASWIGMSGRTV